MISNDDKRAEYPSNLSDLRQVPLAEIPALRADLGDVLHRVVPAAQPGQVPVAAFNSSI